MKAARFREPCLFKRNARLESRFQNVVDILGDMSKIPDAIGNEGEAIISIFFLPGT